MKTVRDQVVDANAVGDLAALAARLDALGPVIATQREARKAERAQRAAESRVAEGGHRRRGREARRRQRLAQRRQPAARAPRPVEGAPPHRPRPPTTRSGAASPPPAPPTPVAASRTSPSSTRSGTPPGWSRSGWPPRPRVWPTRPTGVRPPAAFRDLMKQWKAAGPAPARRRRRAVEAVPRRPGHLLRGPRRRHRRAGQGVRRQRRGQGEAPGRGRGAAAGHATSRPPSGRCATSPTAGRPPARSRATG